MKVKDYRNMAFESACYRTPEYIAFEKACRRELKKQCAERGINLYSFHGNHFGWSAVLERGGRFVYVRMSDVRWFDWYGNMLIRTMEHDKDWHGGHNNNCAFNEVGEYAERLFEGM